ncbi:MAG: serine/threonine-protein kinase [Candidatus Sumerlaeia bacterium]|nr:serine/threonine-protein kinase [Candidatus Sumerlaeia bacterium]
MSDLSPTAPADLPEDSRASYTGPAPPSRPPATAASHPEETIALRSWVVGSLDAGAGREPAAQGGEYLLVKRIGLGGMGEVWEGRQLSLARDVAIKRIRPERLERGPAHGLAWEFQQEALIAARLEHPNIVPVHDLGADGDGNPLLAMKLVRGRRWTDLLAEGFDALPVEEFLARHVAILAQVANAVAFAHSRGVVHRDLKPGQVLVGEFGEVLLTDWGLAVLFGVDQAERAANSHLDLLPTIDTATGPCGTAAFMAPEQTRSDATRVGPWTDVYLLGGTLYHLLTGGVPHEGRDARETFLRAALGEVAPPSTLGLQRTVPRELEDLAMWAMSPEVNNRVPSAAIFAAKLQAYLGGSSRRAEAARLLDELEADERELPHSYDALSKRLTGVSRAVELWPGSDRAHGLRERTFAQFAREALRQGDLRLARLQAEQLEGARERTELLGRIDAEEAARRGQERQRRALAAVSAALAVLVVAGLAIFTSVVSRKNSALAAEKEAALTARADAERSAAEATAQRSVAEERARLSRDLAGVLLQGLPEALDLRSPRDLAIRDRVADQVAAFYAAMDFSGDSDEAAADAVRDLLRDGQILAELARFEDAEALTSRALELIDARPSIPEEARLSAMYSLGEFARERGDLATAIEVLRKVVRDAAELEAEDARRLSIYAAQDLKLALIAAGRGDEAAELGKSLFDSARASAAEEPEWWAVALNDRANELLEEGDVDGALEALAEATAVLRALPAEDRRGHLANTLNSYGAALREAGAPTEAEALLRESLALAEEESGSGHPDCAVPLNNLGLALLDAGRAEEAVPLFRRALTIEEEAYGELHPNVPNRLNNLGSALEVLGRLAEAEAQYRRGIAIEDARGGGPSVMGFTLRNNIGLLLYKLGRLDEGDAALSECLAMYGALGADNRERMELRAVHAEHRAAAARALEAAGGAER